MPPIAPKKSIFLSTSDQLDSMRVAHDGALLPIIKEAKKSQRERNFYVVHLMGNHMDYKKRYPEYFYKFKRDDIALPFTQKQKVALACCDNSVLYNDYVVNEIHRMRTASSSISAITERISMSKTASSGTTSIPDSPTKFRCFSSLQKALSPIMRSFGGA